MQPPRPNDACKSEHAQKAGGQWRVRATFGGPGNAGEPFDMIVALAEAQASAALDAKQREWCRNNDYPGWLTIDLPQGIAEKARIRVFRK